MAIVKHEYVVSCGRWNESKNNYETKEFKGIESFGEANKVRFSDKNEGWQCKVFHKGKCSCGKWVELYRFTNTCQCGIDYNSSGEQLASREQWGEETGEHWTDCY